MRLIDPSKQTTQHISKHEKEESQTESIKKKRQRNKTELEEYDINRL
jgi:hypothetical protein